jgi:hypothetical protein
MVIGPKLVSCAWIYDTVLPIQINMVMAISEFYTTIMAIFEDSPVTYPYSHRCQICISLLNKGLIRNLNISYENMQKYRNADILVRTYFGPLALLQLSNIVIFLMLGRLDAPKMQY